MTPATDPLETVNAIMEAWSRSDVEGVLAHVTDDIEWHYQVGSRPVVGRDTMAKLLNKLAGHQLDSAWRIIRHAAREEANGRTALFVEAIDDYRNPDGHRVQVPYAGVYELVDGKVAAWRDYVDMGLMSRAEIGEALPAWIEALVTRPPAD